MRRTENPEAIWLKFGMLVDITDVVTYTNFGDHRLRGFWVAAGQIFPTPIDFHRRPYNTLALPCKCVISSNNNYCTHCHQKVYICSATCIACSRVDGRSGKCVYRIGAWGSKSVHGIRTWTTQSVRWFSSWTWKWVDSWCGARYQRFHRAADRDVQTTSTCSNGKQHCPGCGTLHRLPFVTTGPYRVGIIVGTLRLACDAYHQLGYTYPFCQPDAIGTHCLLLQ